jgi:phage baseplate assembly protein W
MAYKLVRSENIGTRDTQGEPIGVKYPFNGSAVFGQVFTTLDKALSNLKCLILTRKGERYVQPNFGTDLLYLIFEPNITELKDEIITALKEPIAYWLPYIIITEITVLTKEDDPTLIHNVKITLGFTVAGLVDNTKITIFANENGILQVE